MRCCTGCANMPLTENFGMPPFRTPKPHFSPREWIRARGKEAAAAQAPASRRSLALALAISGLGGGSWTVRVNGTGTFSYIAGCESADSVARMTSACFQDLVCGRKSLAESLDEGRLVLYGDQSGLDQLQFLVQIAAARRPTRLVDQTTPILAQERTPTWFREVICAKIAGFCQGLSQ